MRERISRANRRTTMRTKRGVMIGITLLLCLSIGIAIQGAMAAEESYDYDSITAPTFELNVIDEKLPAGVSAENPFEFTIKPTKMSDGAEFPEHSDVYVHYSSSDSGGIMFKGTRPDNDGTINFKITNPATYGTMNIEIYMKKSKDSTDVLAKGKTSATLYATDVVARDSNRSSYSVTHFDANGGTGTMEDQYVKNGTGYIGSDENSNKLFFTISNAVGKSGNVQAYDESGTLEAITANAFTRDGYTFTGWNTKADGTGTAYDDKGKSHFVGHVTLYAQWKKADAEAEESKAAKPIALSYGDDVEETLPSDTSADKKFTHEFTPTLPANFAVPEDAYYHLTSYKVVNEAGSSISLAMLMTSIDESTGKFTLTIGDKNSYAGCEIGIELRDANGNTLATMEKPLAVKINAAKAEDNTTEDPDTTGDDKGDTGTGTTGEDKGGTGTGATGEDKGGTSTGTTGDGKDGTGTTGDDKGGTGTGITGEDKGGTSTGTTGDNKGGTGTGATGDDKGGTGTGTTGDNKGGTGTGTTGDDKGGTGTGTTGDDKGGTGTGTTGEDKGGTSTGTTGDNKGGTGTGATGDDKGGTGTGTTGDDKGGTGTGTTGDDKGGTGTGTTGDDKGGTGTGTTGEGKGGTGTGTTGEGKGGTGTGTTGEGKGGTGTGTTGEGKGGTGTGTTGEGNGGTGTGTTGKNQSGTTGGTTGDITGENQSGTDNSGIATDGVTTNSDNNGDQSDSLGANNAIDTNTGVDSTNNTTTDVANDTSGTSAGSNSTNSSTNTSNPISTSNNYTGSSDRGIMSTGDVVSVTMLVGTLLAAIVTVVSKAWRHSR